MPAPRARVVYFKGAGVIALWNGDTRREQMLTEEKLAQLDLTFLESGGIVVARKDDPARYWSIPAASVEVVEWVLP